jgi:acyl dehydratase
MTAATVFANLDAVAAGVGRHLGYSDWVEITQERIDTFAEATGDHQWIHVDTKRAAEGPFGTTIAHGYLTMSLSNLFLPQIVDVQGISMGINYGVNKVRFPAPVPVGSRVRGGASLAAAEPIAGGLQTTIVITIEIEGSAKPACVIEALSRYLA